MEASSKHTMQRLFGRNTWFLNSSQRVLTDRIPGDMEPRAVNIGEYSTAPLMHLRFIIVYDMFVMNIVV